MTTSTAAARAEEVVSSLEWKFHSTKPYQQIKVELSDDQIVLTGRAASHADVAAAIKIANLLIDEHLLQLEITIDIKV